MASPVDEGSSPQERAALPPAVSIIVPVGGRGDGFDRCVASIGRLEPAAAEVIVVVDGDDPEFRRLGESAADVVVGLQPARGPAAARNRGARESHGEILYFVDSDVELPLDAVARIAGAFRADCDLAALIGSYDDAPGDPAFLSQFRNLLHHWVHQHGRTEASTFWGACGAIRRATFEEIGGFDERFDTPSIEDIELGSRLRRAGRRIVLLKDLQVKHLKQWRVADMIHTDLWRRAIPWTELMLRQGELLNDLNVSTTGRLSVVLAYAVLACLIGAVVWPPLLAGAGLGAILLGSLNAGLYAWFGRLRGPFFALRAAVWHWVHLLVCGLGFALGALRLATGEPRR